MPKSVTVCGCLTLQSKQRKMREKYGDQDEEERQLRMNILAVSNQIHVQ